MDSVRIAVVVCPWSGDGSTIAGMSARLLVLAAALFVAAGYLVAVDLWASWLFAAGGTASLIAATVQGAKALRRRRLARA